MAEIGTALLPHIAGRLLGVPLTLTPRKLETILRVLGPRVGLDLSATEFAALTGPITTRSTRTMIKDGVAVIPIFGTLVKRTGSAQPESGMTPTSAIAESFRAALADPAVKSILLQLDSDGGEVAGIFDLADEIVAARGQKRIWAVSDESAFSAAYALASAADRIILPRSGGVGSIGVIAVHLDQSRAIDAAGYTPTIIRSGSRKADVNPLEPLSTDARDALQGEVDRLAGIFAGLVGRNRGLDPEAVLALQGATFEGKNAISAGLADELATFDQAFTKLAAMRRLPGRRNSMAASVDLDEGKVIDLDAERQKATERGALEGKKAERLRVQAIHDLCQLGTLAGLPADQAESLATSLIESDATEAQARDAVLKARAALTPASQEVHARIGAEATGTPVHLDAAAIFANRRKQVEALQARRQAPR